MKLGSLSGPRLCLLLLVLVLAFGVRFLYLSEAVYANPLRGDASQYFASAYNLFHNGVYSSQISGLSSDKGLRSDASRGPGYPFFLMPFLTVSQDLPAFFNNVFLVQAVIGTLSVGLTFWLGYMIFGAPGGLFAALLLALTPQVIALEGNLLSETLFTFSLLVAVVVLVSEIREASMVKLFGAGFFFGVAALVRLSALPIGPFVGLFRLARHASGKSLFRWARFRCYLLFLVGFLTAVGPFFVRNTVVLGSPLPKSSKAWENFLMGSYPDYIYKNGGTYGYPYRDDPAYPRMFEDKDEAWRIIGERFRAEPWKYLRWYLLGKIVGMWQWDQGVGGTGDVYVFPLESYPFQSDAVLAVIHLVMRILHVPLLLAALAGVVYFLRSLRSSWRRDREDGPGTARRQAMLLFFGMLLLQTVLLIILFPVPRLMVPFTPYMLLFAFFGLQQTGRLLGDWRSLRRERRQPVSWQRNGALH